MKKSIFGKALAFLAAGALAFAALGCDDGNGEYQPEVPTTYMDLEGTNSDNVTAKWDFSGGVDSSPWNLQAGSAYTNEELAVSEGAGATLTALSIKINNVNSLNLSNGSVSLSDLSAAHTLLLTLDEDSNVTIVAKGAGNATSARLLAVKAADASGTATGDFIVSKDNLSSGKEVTFKIAGAPAGNYVIYMNGSAIQSIDCTAEVTAPALVQALKLSSVKDSYTKVESIASFEAYENAATTLFVASVTEDDDTVSFVEDLTADAVWTSTNESVATVTATEDGATVTGVAPGKAIIRARIGRFYDQIEVTVTESTKTRVVYFASEKITTTKELGTDWTAENVKAVADAILTPVVKGTFATGTKATMTFTEDASFTGSNKAPTVVKDDAAGSSFDKRLGVAWKSDATADADTNIANLTFKIAPSSGTVKLARVEADAFSGNQYAMKITVGSKEVSQSQIKKATPYKFEFEDMEITGETDVTVTFISPKNASARSFNVKDIAFVITK